MAESEWFFKPPPPFMGFYPDYCRQMAVPRIDPRRRTETLQGSTGIGRVRLDASIESKLDPKRLEAYELALTFFPGIDGWEKFLPFGQVIISPRMLEIDGNRKLIPAAMFRSILPEDPKGENPTLFLAGHFVQIHFPDQILRLSPPHEKPRVIVFYQDEDPSSIPPNIWTKLASGSILKVTPPRGDRRSWEIEFPYGIASSGFGSKIIINKVTIPPIDWGKELLKILIKTPQDLERIFRLLTEKFPFENLHRFASFGEKETILSLFNP